MYQNDVKELGGSFTREPKHTHMVSFWYIPGACDYANAQIAEAFFDNYDSANTFLQSINAPPECPDLIVLN